MVFLFTVPHPLLPCPGPSPIPSLLLRVGHMEPISLVTLKSRRCARLPPWRPRGPRASSWPRQSPLLSPGDSVTSQTGSRTNLGCPHPGARFGGTADSPYPEHPWAGAVLRPPQAEQSRGRGRGAGRPLSPSSPSPPARRGCSRAKRPGCGRPRRIPSPGRGSRDWPSTLTRSPHPAARRGSHPSPRPHR